MDDTEAELKALDRATQVYKRTEAAHEKSRQAAIDAVVVALRAGEQPTVVARRSPFTAAYVRVIAREANIPPAGPGIKPAKKSTARGDAGGS